MEKPATAAGSTADLVSWFSTAGTPVSDEPLPTSGPGGGRLRRHAAPAWLHFDAEAYLRSFYSAGVTPDEERALCYQIDVLASAGPFRRGLEYRCGPTLLRAIAAAPYVERLDMVDVSPRALDQVERWRAGAPTAHPWHPFTRFILECERGRGPDAAELVGREDATRRVLGELIVSDLHTDLPFGRRGGAAYDLLVSAYCLECAGPSLVRWRRGLGRLLSVVVPGGTIVLVGMRNGRATRVADRWFPACPVDEDLLYAELLKQGVDRSSIDIHTFPTPDFLAFGWGSILLASMRR